jgi:hypothetical protein
MYIMNTDFKSLRLFLAMYWDVFESGLLKAVSPSLESLDTSNLTALDLTSTLKHYIRHYIKIQ